MGGNFPNCGKNGVNVKKTDRGSPISCGLARPRTLVGGDPTQVGGKVSHVLLFAILSLASIVLWVGQRGNDRES